MTRHATSLHGLRAGWAPDRNAVRGSCPALRQRALGAYERVEQAHDQHVNRPREGAGKVTNRIDLAIDLARLGPMSELPPGLPSIVSHPTYPYESRPTGMPIVRPLSEAQRVAVGHKRFQTLMCRVSPLRLIPLCRPPAGRSGDHWLRPTGAIHSPGTLDTLLEGIHAAQTHPTLVPGKWPTTRGGKGRTGRRFGKRYGADVGRAARRDGPARIGG